MTANGTTDDFDLREPECARVAADHPMLAGHFPDQPIVPGAWLLAWVVTAARRALTSQSKPATRTITAVRRVKFRKPLRPEQPFECTLSTPKRASGLESDDVETMRFVVTSNAAVVAEGSLQLKPSARD